MTRRALLVKADKMQPDTCTLIDAKRAVEQMIKELASVQPMHEAGKAITQMYDSSRTEQQLIHDGYTPVSHLKLMWIKKDNK